MSCELLGIYSSGVWEDLGQPSGISPAYISGYIIDNLGRLNILIDTCFSGDGSGCVTPALSIFELAIAGEMYKESFYSKKIRDSLGANGYGEQWISIREGDTSIQRASPTQVAREYRELKKDATNNIQNLSYLYKNNLVVPHSIDFANVYERYVSDDSYYPSLNRL